MTNSNLKNIYEKIKKANNVLILTHLNPDGDAIGSMLALKLIITRLNIEVDGLITETKEFMKVIPHSDTLLKETNKTYDLTILVDVSPKDRLGSLEYLYDNSKDIIILDHHLVDIDTNITHYIDPNAASTTMIIYNFIKDNNILLDYDLALYLYIGLITDTGGFAHNNTTSAVFDMASDLIKYGINHNELYLDLIKQEYDMNYLMLKRIALDNLEIIEQRIAITFLSYEDIRRYPFDNPKTFLDSGRYLQGIEVSLIFIEEEVNSYKVSLRSKKYLDVSEVAKKFNGGGHKFAAGIRFKDNYEQTKNEIINAIIDNLK